MSERNYSIVNIFCATLNCTYVTLACDCPLLGQVIQKTSTTKLWFPIVSPDCDVVTLVDQRDYKSVAQHVVFKMFLSVCSTVESADWLTPGCCCVKTDPTPTFPGRVLKISGRVVVQCSWSASLTSNKKVHRH